MPAASSMTFATGEDKWPRPIVTRDRAWWLPISDKKD